LWLQYLVSRGHMVEFFIEGSRSRSGKQLHPKFGILGTVVDCFLSDQVDNVSDLCSSVGELVRQF